MQILHQTSYFLSLSKIRVNPRPIERGAVTRSAALAPKSKTKTGALIWCFSLLVDSRCTLVVQAALSSSRG